MFVLVAGLLTPIAVFVLLTALWQSGRVYRHPALGPLRKHGKPQSVVARIEDEIATLGDAASAGPPWVSPNWIVLLIPELKVYDVNDKGSASQPPTTNKGT